MGNQGHCCDTGVFLSAVGGGSAILSGGTCGFGDESSCSSIVTGGSNIILGSGQGPVMGSCSVSSSGSGAGSGSSCHTILKKTVESSLKTSITY